MIFKTKSVSKMYIYLDQKIWIALALSYYKMKDGEKFDKALELITNLKKQNKIFFPISSVHYEESTTRTKDESREGMAKLIKNLSDGCSILPMTSVLKTEIWYSVKSKMGEKIILDPKKMVFGKGIDFSTGSYLDSIEVKSDKVPQDVINQIFTKIKSSPSEVAEFLLAKYETSLLRTEEEIQEEIDELENFRKSIETLSKEKKEIRLIDALIPEFINPTFNEIINKKNIYPETFFKNNNKRDFIDSLPSFYTYYKLLFSIMNNKTRKIDKNDNKDLFFLSVAIPYCDVVVTENYWAHEANKAKLGEKYNTKIFANLDELYEYLVII
jgi:hypothetical protein